MKADSADQIGAYAAKATVAASGTTFLWSWLNQELLFSMLGLLVGVVTGFITWYYKRQSDQRDARDETRRAAEAAHRAEERALRMQLMREHGYPILPRESMQRLSHYELMEDEKDSEYDE